MKKVLYLLNLTIVLSICVICLHTNCFANNSFSTINTISGFVFGIQRLPLADVNVELLDEYSRSISRTRTNSSGKYSFTGMRSGRFKVRVSPLGLDYQEQEQDIEIQNISREVNGGIFTSASDNVQKDFYLRPRKTTQIFGQAESIFVQEIPKLAQDTFNKGIKLLEDKKESEGWKEIKTAIEIFPDYYEALEKLGSEYIRTQHYIPAQILFTQAVKVNPRGYKSWYGLAYSLYSQKQSKEALEAILVANSLSQNSVDCSLLAGVLLKQAGKFNEAEKSLKRAKELSKNSVAEINWQLALLYGNNLKRYREAADELEQFLKVNPNVRDSENIKKLIIQFREKDKK